jgi:hypothetical protein
MRTTQSPKKIRTPKIRKGHERLALDKMKMKSTAVRDPTVSPVPFYCLAAITVLVSWWDASNIFFCGMGASCPNQSFLPQQQLRFLPSSLHGYLVLWEHIGPKSAAFCVCFFLKKFFIVLLCPRRFLIPLLLYRVLSIFILVVERSTIYE